MRQNKYKRVLIRWVLEVAIFVVAIFVIFWGVNHFWLRPVGSELSNKVVSSKLAHKKLTYVAIGDSLTEGVGDNTKQGGFVPLLVNDLDATYDVNVVSQNFGVAGETSKQIYDRVTSQNKIQKAIQTADIITITVGGNDVLKVISKHFATLTESSFDKPAKTYQNQLTKLFDYIRQSNQHAKVFILGIYNPFYLNFPDITQMQDIIDNWNSATQTIVAKQKKMYFVPINELLYKGIDGTQGITEGNGDTKTIKNDALFDGDHFHPNNIGYQIMSDAVVKAYKEHVNEK